MNTRARRTLGIAATLVSLVACGGAQKQEASTPSSAANGATNADAVAAESSPPKPGLALPDATRAPAVGDPSAKQVGIQAQRFAIVEDSLRRIERDGHDCADACRALGSMDHACGELCATASGSDERAVCDRASRKVRTARETVKKACGSCPGGASVEPQDPIPSRPLR